MDEMTDVADNVKEHIKQMCGNLKAEILQQTELKISNVEKYYDLLLKQQRQTLTEAFKLWIDSLTTQITQNTEFIGELRGRATQFELQINKDLEKLGTKVSNGVQISQGAAEKEPDILPSHSNVCVSERNVTFSPGSTTKPKHTIAEMDEQIYYLTQEVSDIKSQLRDAENCIDKLEDQSRRNNLKFYGIPEADEESWADSEAAIRVLMRDELKIANADNIEITRAHRMNQKGLKEDEPRPIIVKYDHWKDRQTVLKSSKALKGTPKSISEDFCARTVDYRKKLLPEMYEKREQGLFSTIRYKTVISKPFRKTIDNVSNEPLGTDTD